MHTHTGHIPTPAASDHRWRNGHLGGRAKRCPVHALTDAGRVYRAICGVTVERRYGNDSDLDGPVTGHVRPAGEQAVTCERCRKIMESDRGES